MGYSLPRLFRARWPCCQWRFRLHRETPRGTWPVVRGSVVALVEPVLPGEDTISLTCA